MKPDRGAVRRPGRLSRRSFLGGVTVGAAGMWAAAVLPRRTFGRDPHRPPKLYEFYVDSLWFESAGLLRDPAAPPLRGRQRADVAVLGGGFAGMSAAYHLSRLLPGQRIVLVEGARCGYGASGRNGGFADPGMPGLGFVYESRGPEAARAYYDATLLGLAQIREFADRHGVHCDLEQNGSLELATDEAQLEELAEEKRRFDAMGIETEWLDGDSLRQKLASERFVGALRHSQHAVLNPAKLARGMKRVIEAQGVEVFEHSKVMRVEAGRPVRVATEFGELLADRVVVALNGYAPRIGLFEDRILPLCNYVAATDPLSDAQLAQLGWSGRESLSDRRVQFMYLRLTADNRIVFGGESAPYFYGGEPSSGNYAPAHTRLERSLRATFPQLGELRLSHAWGGTMGFTRDFMPSIGRLPGAERIFYALGFCGEGVVMTQLAGRIVAELVAGVESELTALPIVDKAMPSLGPAWLRYPAVKLYERALRLRGRNPVRG